MRAIFSRIKRLVLQNPKKMIGADLRKADLAGKVLTNYDLRRADLAQANLKKAQLSKISLAKANLEFANLAGANLEEASLKSANLKNSILKGTNLKNADLMWADLRGANLESANLEGALLHNARLEGAILRNVNISGITYSKSTIWPESYVPSDHLISMTTGVENNDDLARFLISLGQSRAIDYDDTLTEYLKSLLLLVEETKETSVSCQYIAQLFNNALDYKPIQFDKQIWKNSLLDHEQSLRPDHTKAQQILLEQIIKIDDLTKSELNRMEYTVDEYLIGSTFALKDKDQENSSSWEDIIELLQSAWD